MDKKLLTLLLATTIALASTADAAVDKTIAIVGHARRGDPDRSPIIVFYDDMEGDDDGGWTTVDNTAAFSPKFHLDTYLAYSGTSWWCGEKNVGFAGGDGYGNNWDQRLELPAIDVSAATYPILQFAYRCDSEPAYDFTYVQAESAGAFVNLNRGFDGTQGWTVHPGLAVGPSMYDDPLTLRFRFVSDVGWSDEDGLYDSHGGAFHVDDITVYDYYGGTVYFYEDCETGGLCTPSVPAPSGDWWHKIDRRCAAYSGTRSWWCGDDGDTSVVPPNLDNSLISPEIDLAGATICTLRFLLHAEVPTEDDDFWTEEITTDGGATWHMIGAWWGDFGRCDGWSTHGINGVDLSPFLPGTIFQFRVTMHTTANGCGPGSAGGAGVMLDDTWLEDWTGSAVEETTWGKIKAMYR